MVLTSRSDFSSCIFREVIILAAWSIWSNRNNITFDGKTLYFAAWRAHFTSEVNLVTLRAKPEIKERLKSFLSSL
ncbi:hypothetical protein HU200_047687 [Digitaria exilis]|uniref:Uncharacterized protein n=1 Tax=Digitaria exilis TaxID=1010633 RepID=A0A835AXP3_9POAL|nr:hypothetical protein HU200_047687 [Digitaria exilis]